MNKVKEILLAQESKSENLPHSHGSDSGDAKDRLVKLKELLSEDFRLFGHKCGWNVAA